MAAILAAMAALGEVVNNMVQFAQNIGLLLGGDDVAAQLQQIEEQLAGLEAEVQQVSKQILVALAQLDQEVFGTTMADILADVDAAGVALAEWSQAGDDASRDQALASSQTALATILELYANGVYPPLSMVFVLARGLLQRLAVLAIFKDVASPADIAQLGSAIQEIQAVVNSLVSQITAANQIRSGTQVNTVSVKPVRVNYEAYVYYSNISGDKAYNNVTFASTVAAMQASLANMLTAAHAVANQGMQEDLDRAQVPSLSEVVSDAHAATALL